MTSDTIYLLISESPDCTEVSGHPTREAAEAELSDFLTILAEDPEPFTIRCAIYQARREVDKTYRISGGSVQEVKA